jgi:hypothetical protein
VQNPQSASHQGAQGAVERAVAYAPLEALDDLHVLCEKPLANSLAEANDMLRHAQVAGVSTWCSSPGDGNRTGVS